MHQHQHSAIRDSGCWIVAFCCQRFLVFALMNPDCRVNQRSPGRREFPRSRPARHQSPSAPFGCGAQIGCMRGKITRMEIRRRLGPVVMNHLGAREDEQEDWGEPPPFWFVRSWGNYRATKFRTFSLVLVLCVRPLESIAETQPQLQPALLRL